MNDLLFSKMISNIDELIWNLFWNMSITIQIGISNLWHIICRFTFETSMCYIILKYNPVKILSCILFCVVRLRFSVYASCHDNFEMFTFAVKFIPCNTLHWYELLAEIPEWFYILISVRRIIIEIWEMQGLLKIV